MLTGTIFIKKSNFLDKIKSIIEPLVKSLSITKLRSLSIPYKAKYSWSNMRSQIYEEIKNNAKEYSLDSFLKKYYADDIKLCEALKATNKNLTPQNLLTSTKRLENLL